MRVSEYKVREFEPRDLDAVIEINRRNLPENYPVFFFKLYYENFSKAFLVAESEGRVVGYVICRVEVGKLYTRNGTGRQGHIVSIAVVPEMRRKGVGTALMLRTMDALYRHYLVDEYYLEVRVSNTSAINLYKKLKFQPIKVIKGYYVDGENAYLMAKPAP